MGNRRALMVGINQYGGRNNLNGCVNDINLIHSIIVTHYGFTDQSQVKILTDATATTANIISGLHWLIEGAKSGDVLLFHYSGHGTQFIDTDPYVPNSRPELMEAICPVDLDWHTKIIRDKDFKHIFSQLPANVNLTVILDSCHSGGGIRDIDNPLIDEQFKFIEMPEEISKRGEGLNLQLPQRTLQDPHIINYEDQCGILIAGCKSTETSSDAWINNCFHGACTYFLSNVLQESNYDITYNDLIEKMNIKLSSFGYAQHPELDCSASLVTKKFLQPY